MGGFLLILFIVGAAIYLISPISFSPTGKVAAKEYSSPIIEDVGIREVSLIKSGTQFEFYLEVDNPNPVEAKLKEVVYDINLEGKDASKGKISQTVLIPKNSRETITHNNDFKISSDLVAGWFGTLSNTLLGKQTYWRISGHAIFEVANKTYDRDFSTEQLVR